VGTGNPQNEAELVGCFAEITAGNGYDPSGCPWFATPPKPQAADQPGHDPARRISLATTWYRGRRVCLLYLHEWTTACAGKSASA
jgi:hypothetical protein